MPLSLIESPARATPRSKEQIQGFLIERLSKSLNEPMAAIDPAAPLDQLGVDSLMALGIAGDLATFLGRDVPATLTWDYRTIAAIAQALATAPSPRRLPAGVVALQPQGDAIPLFGFPGLLGTPLAFAAVAAKLGNAVPFYGVAVPGFDGVGSPLSSVEEIAAAMLAKIRQVRPRGPYRFAGYCFGGFLAYEAARQLAADGQRVELLALYDTFTAAGRVSRPFWQRMLVHANHLATGKKSPRDIMEKLRPRREEEAAAPEPQWPVDPSLLSDAAKDFWSVNSRAASRYRPGPYDGPILWFGASERRSFNDFYRMMPCGGWSHCTTGRVTSITLPGTHGNLIEGPNAQSAAHALRPFLVAADRT